jgi:3-oxoacyl-(acyl-carrier-protein) synthase
MQATEDAQIHPAQIDAVNCHARSTVSGDNCEAYALHALWSCGNAIKTQKEFEKLTPEQVVSYHDSPLPSKQPILHGQKGHLGHSVAAAGAIESVFSFLTLHNQVVPHIKNLKNPCDPMLRYALENEQSEVNYMMKNGFVFGGINCTLLFKKYSKD